MSYRHRVAIQFAVAVIPVLICSLPGPADAEALTSAPGRGREEDRSGGSAVVRGTGGSGLNVRSATSVDSAIVGVLPEGAHVQILGGPSADGAGDWYRIEGVDDRGAAVRGWVVGSYLLGTGAAGAGEEAAVGGRTFVAEVRAYTTGGEVGQYTASGTRARWGTAAVDPRYVPLGSLLVIDGLGGVFAAEDVGGTIQGAQLDVWFPDLESALRWGVQRRRVTVLRDGY